MQCSKKYEKDKFRRIHRKNDIRRKRSSLLPRLINSETRRSYENEREKEKEQVSPHPPSYKLPDHCWNLIGTQLEGPSGRGREGRLIKPPLISFTCYLGRAARGRRRGFLLSGRRAIVGVQRDRRSGRFSDRWRWRPRWRRPRRPAN